MKLSSNSLLILIIIGITSTVYAQTATVSFDIKKGSSQVGDVVITSPPAFALSGGVYQMNIANVGGANGYMNLGATKGFGFEASIKNTKAPSGALEEVNLDGWWENRFDNPRQLLTKYNIELTNDYARITFTDIVCHYQFNKSYPTGYKAMANVELKIYSDKKKYKDEFSVTITSVTSAYIGANQYSLTNLPKNFPPSIVGLIAKGQTLAGTEMSWSCSGQCGLITGQPPIAAIKGPFVDNKLREIVPVCIGKEVTFDGGDSKDQDENGASIVKYEWMVTPPSGSSSPSGSGKTFSFKPEIEGDYLVKLKVTDNEGQVGEITAKFKGLIPRPVYVQLWHQGWRDNYFVNIGKVIVRPIIKSNTGNIQDLFDARLVIREYLRVNINPTPLPFRCNYPDAPGEHKKPEEWASEFLVPYPGDSDAVYFSDSHSMDQGCRPKVELEGKYIVYQRYEYEIDGCRGKIVGDLVRFEIEKGFKYYSSIFGGYWGFYVNHSAGIQSRPLKLIVN